MAKRKSPRVSAKTKKPIRKASKAKPKAAAGAAPPKGKWVYGFGGGRAEGKPNMRNLLGGKGAGLAEMANLGLPVPPGFTITTEVCTYYYANKQQLSEGASQPRSRRRWPRSGESPARFSATRVTRCWCRCAPAPAPRCRA